MSTRRPGDLALAETAAGWVTRRRTDQSPECSQTFMKWLKESPRHVDEYLAAATTIALLRGGTAPKRVDIDAMLAASELNVMPLEGAPREAEAGSPAPRAPTRLAARRYAMAAAVAGLAVTAWFVVVYLGNTYTTGVGEQRMVQLPDGSLLHLNTDSRVRIAFSKDARELKLITGEAFFTVAQDRERPFRVITDDASVQAIGTQFNVYRHGEDTQVAVLDGRVRVADSAGSSSDLGAGEQADVTARGIVRNAVPLDSALAWRERRLIFWGVPLSEVAAQFNRYNADYRIRVDDALSSREMWGTFRVDQPQALIKFLQQDDTVAVETTRDGAAVRKR